jgi:hypothetical protein
LSEERIYLEEELSRGGAVAEKELFDITDFEVGPPVGGRSCRKFGGNPFRKLATN